MRPGEPDYDVYRKIWNGSIDKRPALIIRCAGVSDVIAAVKFGRASGLPVAVRSGGHSFPGLSVADDALMIDLQPLKGVRVDPEKAHRARASGRAARRARPGDAGVRAGGAVGHRHAHRRRRSDARRRDRLDSAQVRPLRRPARLDGRRHRRRGVRQGERRRERRSVLGPARRRRELRHRHRVRVQLRPARHAGSRRADLLADGAVGRSAALLPRLGRGRAGRPDDDHRAQEGAAAAVRSAGAAREAGRDGDRVLGR